MTTEIRVPTLGESVTEATVAKWFKQVGDAVALDEPLCELETDKVALEVNATAAGRRFVDDVNFEPQLASRSISFRLLLLVGAFCRRLHRRCRPQRPWRSSCRG